MKNSNKKTLFILIPLLSVSLLSSLAVSHGSSRNADAASIGIRVNQGNYDVNGRKHEAPATHEPLFKAIFKFIVNCNPFRKESSR